jgi:hypothetical protein
MTTATRNVLYGDKAYAMGPDPTDQTTYELRYKVIPLSELIASHDDNMQPNEKYPQELQPRIRDRAASRTQVDNIARNLNPKVLLHDTGFIDTGAMIVGDDNVVESGNGRVLALRRAMNEYPEKYRFYKTMLINQADKYGLSSDAIESIKNPVLVRERITKVDRAEFARQANVGAVMGMSPYEQANQDAKKLSAEVVSQIQVGEEQTIDQALRTKANDHIVNAFVKNIPANERATISDEKGNLNLQGINRLKLALFAKTYTGEAGQRLTRIFGESADPYVKQIENAMFQSLPDMAKAESMIASGDRESNLSVAPDLAEIIDTYAGIKANGITVKDYLNQRAMFEERLSPYQKALLGHFDTISRKPKLIREFIRDNAQRIISAPPKGQISMMGSDPITKESITYGVINSQRKELGETPLVYQPATVSKGLAESHAGRTESTEELGTKPEAYSGTVQTGLEGFGIKAAQADMLGEFSGKLGAKPGLYDVEKLKEQQESKPLPGQIEMTPQLADGVIIENREIKANPDNIPMAKAFVAELRKQADKVETQANAVTPSKAKRLRGEAHAARRDANKIEKSIPHIAELRAIHNTHSTQSKAMDESQQHSIVVNPDSPRVKQWIRNPGSMDIQGIDTKSRQRIIKQPKARKLKSSDRELGYGIVESRTKYGRRRHLRLT